MTMLPRILIIEDDPNLQQSIQDFLEPFADVEAATDGFTGQFMAEQDIYDLIILDIMLPEINGFDLLTHLRHHKIDTPVLILTAKAELSDKLHGFELGGDDYLTKPFHREELIMRVKALLKRTGSFFSDQELVAGPIHLDLAAHQVHIAEEPVTLNGKEFDLLMYLMQNQGTIITKNQIFDRLWGFDSDTALTVVEVYMSNLRRKLKATAADGLIKTIRNVGYILTEEN
ncbi:response regulator transcription factor [Lacticaseibacillus saniviri]